MHQLRGVGEELGGCPRCLFLAGRVVHGVQEEASHFSDHRTVGYALGHAVEGHLSFHRVAGILHDLRRAAAHIGNEFVRHSGLCVHVRHADVDA